MKFIFIIKRISRKGMHFSFPLVICAILLLNSCNSRTGIDGDKNTNNTIIIGNGNTIKTTAVITDTIPDDFLKKFHPNTPISKLVALFGQPDQIFTLDSEYSELPLPQIAHTYFWSLANGYISISSYDDLSINDICVHSNGERPFIKMYRSCPLDEPEDSTNLLFGKSQFSEVFPFLDRSNYEVEVAHDKGGQYALLEFGFTSPCSYYYFLGSTVLDTKLLKPTKGETTFEGSDGIYLYSQNDSTLLNYIIITNNRLLTQRSHYYGEGIHIQMQVN